MGIWNHRHENNQQQRSVLAVGRREVKMQKLTLLKDDMATKRIEQANNNRFTLLLYRVVESVASCLEYVDFLKKEEVHGVEISENTINALLEVADTLTRNLEVDLESERCRNE